jgi:hypothetical protein
MCLADGFCQAGCICGVADLVGVWLLCRTDAAA